MTVSEAERAFGDVRSLLRRSEYLKAFDLARTAVDAHPEHVGLRHRGVLALARAGATTIASEYFVAWGLDGNEKDADVLALRGRLLKDEAIKRDGADRQAALVKAAEAYERAFAADTGNFFPAINVATLMSLAGRREIARKWAEVARDLTGAQEDFYATATRAEALLILGKEAEAGDALRLAGAASNADAAAVSTTRAQLARLVSHFGSDPALLDPLQPPRVAHFCGHLAPRNGAEGRLPASQFNRVQAEAARIMEENRIEFGVGSLAAGSDILIAEALLARGGELDVVLPFQLDEFIEISVRPSGEGWVERFNACLSGADDVHFVTEDGHLGHDELFNYASHFALGLAKLRGQMLGAEVHQIAVWDGQMPGDQEKFGTVFDLEIGSRSVQRQHVVSPTEDGTAPVLRTPPVHRPRPDERKRHTMIFGDIKGFSKLSDAQLPAFVNVVLGTCAHVFEQFDHQIKFRNTWGDGLFLVFDDDVSVAADCALELQAAVRGIDPGAIGVPERLGLRLGLHYGPVFEAYDPVLKRTNFFGYHVSRAARVEPITPEGLVYVSEAAAAALAVDAPDRFRCEYVGRVPLAKGYGEFPMHLLSRFR